MLLLSPTKTKVEKIIHFKSREEYGPEPHPAVHIDGRRRRRLKGIQTSGRKYTGSGGKTSFCLDIRSFQFVYILMCTPPRCRLFEGAYPPTNQPTNQPTEPFGLWFDGACWLLMGSIDLSSVPSAQDEGTRRNGRVGGLRKTHNTIQNREMENNRAKVGRSARRGGE